MNVNELKKKGFKMAHTYSTTYKKTISDSKAIYINTCAFESMLSKDVEILDSQTIGYKVTFLDIQNESKTYFLDSKNLKKLFKKNATFFS
jgi:hypothetical protein